MNFQSNGKQLFNQHVTRAEHYKEVVLVVDTQKLQKLNQMNLYMNMENGHQQKNQHVQRLDKLKELVKYVKKINSKLFL